jgi:8-oxo-dGTP diphosphatase
MRKSYVVGLLFRNDATEVALIDKTRPEWQRGRKNGIGGEIEPGETSLAAMEREFKEEAGASVSGWRMFCQLHHQDRVIYYFVAHGDYQLTTMTDEKVGWYEVAHLSSLPIIPNLKWLVPLALDKDGVTAVVEDQS